MNSDPPEYLHATGAVVGTAGVLVTGGSGSGKSSLALELVARCRMSGHFACLVADDQLIVAARHGRLVVSAPPPIAGLAEIRGHGVAAIDHETAAVADLIVELVEPDEAPRHRRDLSRTVSGIELPRLELPIRDTAGSVRAVLAWLGTAGAEPAPGKPGNRRIFGHF